MGPFTVNEEWLEAFRGFLESSTYAVAFTGAGVSAESGIPTFRGDEGIWREYPPAVYGNLPGLALAFLFRRRRLARLASEVLTTLLEASPNPCHHALARLEREGPLRAVITQNVDDLHRVAGSMRVLELHGNAFRLRCSRCGLRMDVDRDKALEARDRLLQPGISRRGLLAALMEYAGACGACGGRTRPDVVLFGESLPVDTMNQAMEEASRCDLLLVLGTSSMVYPAAVIPRMALESGAKLVEVNPNASSISSRAHLRIPLPAGVFFASYLERLT